MAGRTVLQYQILEKLGAGGMGEVYKALDTKLNRFVVLKVLPAGMARDPDRRRRFVQEAQAASALNHPNIITIYDIVSDGDTQYMVVEYVDGKTLLELTPKDGLRPPLAIEYATQMAAALCAAHAAGIIHRDLKPANVMVTNTGLVKLLDFGLAKMVDRTPVDEAAQTVTSLRAPLTVEGAILGTVNYMSPEQAEGKKVDARSDIFSFGAVLYEMLTGRSAFSGTSAISTLSAVLRDNVQPIVELTYGVPPALERIVLRCLQKDPAERFQSAQELQAALAALNRQPESAILPPPPPPAPARTSKTLPILGVCVLVLVAAAGGFWWFTQPRSSPAVTPTPPSQPSVSKPSPMPSQSTPEPPPTSAIPSAPPPPAAARPVPVPTVAKVTIGDGLPVLLTLAEDVPVDAKPGDALRFRAAEDVSVDGSVVIAKGAAASGVVVDAAKKRILGLGGKMTFRLESIDAVDGQRATIRATPKPHRNGSKRAVGSLAAGTEYTAYIDGANTVSVRK